MLGQDHEEYVGDNWLLLSVLLSIRKIWSKLKASSRFSLDLMLCISP